MPDGEEEIEAMAVSESKPKPPRGKAAAGSQYTSLPGGDMRPTHKLSSFDAQFLAAESGPILSNYCGIFVFDPPAKGALDRERVIGLIGSRIDRIPVLRWHLRTVPLGLDHPLFVDGEVDVGRHVFERKVRAPGGPAELAAAGAKIMQERMDRSRPLWELHVISGLEQGRVGLGIKFHHALADALGASTIAGLLMDPNPEGDRPLPPPVSFEEGPDIGRLLLDGLKGTVTYPLKARRAFADSVGQLDQVPMMRTLPGVRRLTDRVRRSRRSRGHDVAEPGPYTPAPRMRFNGPLSSGRSVAFGTVPVEQVKAARGKHGISFNDVVMAAVGGGLRSHLGAAGELPDDPLIAFVPASVRGAEEDGSFGNAISSFVVGVPTHLSDQAQRAAFAAEAMGAAKRRHAQTSPTLMVDANTLIPPLVFKPIAAGMLRLLGTKAIDPPVNMLVSNVPGPQTTVYFSGAPLHSIHPMSLIFPGALLNVTVISYKDRLEIGLVGDAEAIPDVAELCDALVAEFDALAG